MCRGMIQRNVDDLRKPLFWRAVAAETVGTGFLTFFAAGAAMGWVEPDPTVVQLSLTSGLAVSTIISCIASISGGHINPAVSIPMWISGKISLARCVLYVVGQTVGAVGGAAILHGLTPEILRGHMGMNRVHSSVSGGQAFGMEFLITFVLIFVIYAVLDENRPGHGGSKPFAIGLAVVVGHLIGVRYTGASMNPSRAFGPALIANNWRLHWVYWLGPNLGGIAAGVIYDYIFAASPRKLKVPFHKTKIPTNKLEDDQDADVPLKESAELAPEAEAV